MAGTAESTPDRDAPDGAGPTGGGRAGSRRLGRALVFLGVACLLLGGWGSAQYRSALSRAPLLRDPSGIAVDAAGRVYCGVASSRIHVYDASGRIRRVWPVESEGGAFRVRLVGSADEPQLEVALERPAEVRVFDPTGALIERRADETAFERFGDRHAQAFVATDGTRHGFEGTRLVRESGGQRSVLVEAIPLPLRWFADWPWLLVVVFVLGPIGIFAGMVQSSRAG